MRVLGIDIGYGSVKVIFGNDTGEPLKKFKFDSVIGITKANEYIKDQKIFRFKDFDYYVGEDAKALPSENLIDITEYKNLEYYAQIGRAHV